MKSRAPLYAIMTTFATAALIGSAAWWANHYLTSGQAGKDVNRRAWEASYQERDLPIPAGPRDGFWQDEIPKRVPSPVTRWQEDQVDRPGQITIDENGWQHYSSKHPARHKLLILGGSVAFGAYASSEQTTYFSRLGQILDEDPRTASDIVVVASIAWKSSQELAAFARGTEALAPDWLILIDGLNDITNGSNAAALYSEPTETLDGTPWHLQYHELDYRDRAIHYTRNIAKMLTVADQRDVSVLVVLQPALSERNRMTDHEADLFRRVEERFGSLQQLRGAYGALRRGLDAIAAQSDLAVLDASRLFDTQPETTFTDMWHFSDPGHSLLAQAIARQLIPSLLARETRRREEAPADPRPAGRH